MKFRQRKKAREKRTLPLKYAKIIKKVILAALVMRSVKRIVGPVFFHDCVDHRLVWTIIADLEGIVAFVFMALVLFTPGTIFLRLYFAFTALMLFKPRTIFLRLYYKAFRLSRPDKKAKVNELNDRRAYYQLLGECYLHGMMNGEAILYQNREGIKQEIFELQ